MSNNISDKISNTLLGTNEISSIPSLTPDIDISSSNSSSSSMSSFLDWIKDISLTTWLLIILILTFLGFNIFVYLAKGTQGVNDYFAPLVKKVTSIFAGVTGQVVDVSAEGAKAVVNTSADVVTTGLTGVQNITPTEPAQQNSKTKTKGQDVKTTFPQGDIAQANTVNKAINSSTAQKQQVNGEDYQADDAASSIQKGSPKAGWCYIGEDRGFRSCAEVGVNDTCMSGDIFPTQQICVNPSLRA